MTKPGTPDNEEERLEELHGLSLLDRPADERFDRITRLAQRLFDVSSVAITLVDQDRSWYLSKQGLDVAETTRAESLCAHVLLGEDLMVVPDATRDPRFLDNPSVLADPGVRFYAGATIVGPRGMKLGTLALFDPRPRDLSSQDAASLRDLADMVESEIAALDEAAFDELTGLSNRRGFNLSAKLLLEVCRHRDIEATLLLFDIDHFQQLNLTFGGSEGDAALVQFAEHLTTTFRTSDLLARLGGDEFVALLANTAEPTFAVGRLEAMLVSRNAHPMNKYPLEVSTGSAVFTGDPEDTLESLLARAFDEMHTVKRRRFEAEPPE